MRIEKIHVCTGHKAALYALAPGRTQRHFLTAGGDGWVVEWDMDAPDTGKLVAAVEAQVFSLFAAPDSPFIVAGNMNGGLHWIDRQRPDNTRNVQHHRKGVYGFQALDNWLFSIGGDGILTRWDLHAARSVESVQLSGAALRSIAYCPERRELALGGSDNAIYRLDADTLALKETIRDAHRLTVFALAYAPGGARLLSGGRDALLKTWETGGALHLIQEQAAHWYTLNSLCFSPGGQWLFSGSRDKTIKIWDGHSIELLKVVDTLRNGCHTRSVNKLLWQDNCLISCGDDGLAMIWRVG